MTRLTAFARGLRDSMLVGWLLLGALALALVYAFRGGITWWAGVPAVMAVPLIVHWWARALCRLENGDSAGSGVPKGIRTPVTAVKGP